MEKEKRGGKNKENFHDCQGLRSLFNSKVTRLSSLFFLPSLTPQRCLQEKRNLELTKAVIINVASLQLQNNSKYLQFPSLSCFLMYLFFSPPRKTWCVKSFGELASVLHSFSFIPFICLSRSPRHRTLRYPPPPRRYPRCTSPAGRGDGEGGGGWGVRPEPPPVNIFTVSTLVLRERQ